MFHGKHRPTRGSDRLTFQPAWVHEKHVSPPPGQATLPSQTHRHSGPLRSTAAPDEHHVSGLRPIKQGGLRRNTDRPRIRGRRQRGLCGDEKPVRISRDNTSLKPHLCQPPVRPAVRAVRWFRDHKSAIHTEKAASTLRRYRRGGESSSDNGIKRSPKIGKPGGKFGPLHNHSRSIRPTESRQDGSQGFHSTLVAVDEGPRRVRPTIGKNQPGNPATRSQVHDGERPTNIKATLDQRVAESLRMVDVRLQGAGPEIAKGPRLREGLSYYSGCPSDGLAVNKKRCRFTHQAGASTTRR